MRDDREKFYPGNFQVSGFDFPAPSEKDTMSDKTTNKLPKLNAKAKPQCIAKAGIELADGTRYEQGASVPASVLNDAPWLSEYLETASEKEGE